MQVLISLGPELTSDPEAVKGLLERFGITSANPPRDALVVEIMSSLARLAAEGTAICDIGALVRALSSYVSAVYAHYFANANIVYLFFASGREVALGLRHQVLRLARPAWR